MAALAGRAAPVTDAQLELGWIGFHAFGSAEPDRIIAFLRRDLVPMPFLGAALARLLEEYPWQDDGLSRSRRQLLRAAPTGDGRLGTIFQACAAMEAARYLGDVIFLDYAVELATARQPLLRFVDDEPAEEVSAAWRQQVSLTAFGARVLAGAADFVASNGINGWVGGVHPAREEWRYSAAARMVLPTVAG